MAPPVQDPALASGESVTTTGSASPTTTESEPEEKSVETESVQASEGRSRENSNEFTGRLRTIADNSRKKEIEAVGVMSTGGDVPTKDTLRGEGQMVDCPDAGCLDTDKTTRVNTQYGQENTSRDGGDVASKKTEPRETDPAPRPTSRRKVVGGLPQPHPARLQQDLDSPEA